MKDITFNSTVTLPDGTYISCTVVVPKKAAHADVIKTGEMAVSGANHVASLLTRSAARRSERVPF